MVYKSQSERVANKKGQTVKSSPAGKETSFATGYTERDGKFIASLHIMTSSYNTTEIKSAYFTTSALILNVKSELSGLSV
jgi:hypothetical protein